MGGVSGIEKMNGLLDCVIVPMRVNDGRLRVPNVGPPEVASEMIAYNI